MSSMTLIQPHLKDLGGGFNVRRSLPAAQRQSVGPFLFFDHFGPLWRLRRIWRSDQRRFERCEHGRVD